MTSLLPIAENALVLTVNKRLARQIELDEAKIRMEQGQTAWTSPAVFPVDEWFHNIYKLHDGSQWVLTPFQNQLIWEALLESDPNFRRLDPLALRGTADQLARAYSLVELYELGLNPKNFESTEELKAFLIWRSAYQGYLEENQALEQSQLYKKVIALCEQNAFELPEQITLAGFDEITPVLNRWIETLKNQNVAIGFYPHEPGVLDSSKKPSPDSISVRPFENTRAEIVQCARWIRSHYQEGDRVGVISTRLNDSRTLIKNELMAELAPNSVFSWESQELPVNLSLGGALADEPMIKAGLQFLSCTTAPIPLAQFLHVIKSPYYIEPSDEEILDEELEHKLLRKRSLKVFPENAFSLIQPGRNQKKKESSQYMVLRKLVKKWKEYIDQAKGKKRRLPSQWAKHFSETLQETGWPARYRKLNSREIQAYNEWEARLDELATLDLVMDAIDLFQATQLLTRLVSDPTHPFQEQTVDDSPIQVMGLLESAGQKFDRLWVMGCDSDILPELPHPNPFLPLKLQRKHDLPHSSAERQLNFSRIIIDRLIDTAPAVVFSYAEWKDAEPLNCSPLLSDFQVKREISTPGNRLVDQSHELEVILFNEEEPLPVSKNELADIQGGFRIFKNQGDCPFRAFAIHRLLADRHPLPETDYDNIDRGNLTHRVLELFWGETQTQANLKQLVTEGSLEDLVRALTQKAMGESGFKGKWKLQEKYRAIEENRMTNLITSWLNSELNRTDFTVVEQEKREIFEFSGFKLQRKADRIDQYPDGSRLLIDYKTGEATPDAWFKEPVREPQLPLYACDIKPDGIAFAQVKKNKLAVKVAQKEGMPTAGVTLSHFPKKVTCDTWPELLVHWRSSLEHLGEKFKEGKPQIHPIDGEATCRYCSLKTLCRIEELKYR